ARDAVRLARIDHRVGRLRGRRGEDQVGFIRRDELTRHLWGAVGARLRVPDDDFDVVGLAAQLEAVLVHARTTDLVEDVVVTGSEPGQRAGLRADVANHDGAAACRARALDLPAGGQQVG